MNNFKNIRFKKLLICFLLSLVIVSAVAFSFKPNTQEPEVYASSPKFSFTYKFTESSRKKAVYEIYWKTTDPLASATTNANSENTRIAIHFDGNNDYFPRKFIDNSGFRTSTNDNYVSSLYFTANLAESTSAATIKLENSDYATNWRFYNGATNSLKKMGGDYKITCTTASGGSIVIAQGSTGAVNGGGSVTWASSYSSEEITSANVAPTSSNIVIPKTGTTKVYFTASGETKFGNDAGSTTKAQITGATLVAASGWADSTFPGVTVGQDTGGMFFEISNAANGVPFDSNGNYTFQVKLATTILGKTQEVLAPAKITLKRTNYSMNFNASGGSGVTAINVPHGGSFVLPSSTRSGYELVNWQQISTNVLKKPGETVPSITKDENFTAQWEVAPPTLAGTSAYNNVYDGQSHAISVDATHPFNPITYQWYKSDTLIPSATQNSLSVKNVEDSGSYRCDISTQLDGVTKTTSASLTVEISKANYDMSGVVFNNGTFEYAESQSHFLQPIFLKE